MQIILYFDVFCVLHYIALQFQWERNDIWVLGEPFCRQIHIAGTIKFVILYRYDISKTHAEANLRPPWSTWASVFLGGSTTLVLIHPSIGVAELFGERLSTAKNRMDHLWT